MAVSEVSMTIGRLAKVCAVPAPTIRYYEKIALLPVADRTRSDQRRYNKSDVARLEFIRRCRAFGFSIPQVRVLLAVPEGSARDCQMSKELALGRIDEIRAKVADLRALEAELKDVIAQCDVTCGDAEGQVCGAFDQMQCGAAQTTTKPKAG